MEGDGEATMDGAVVGDEPARLCPVALLPRRKFPALSRKEGRVPLAEVTSTLELLPVCFGEKREEAKLPKSVLILITLGMCKIVNIFWNKLLTALVDDVPDKEVNDFIYGLDVIGCKYSLQSTSVASNMVVFSMALKLTPPVTASTLTRLILKHASIPSKFINLFAFSAARVISLQES